MSRAARIRIVLVLTVCILLGSSASVARDLPGPLPVAQPGVAQAAGGCAGADARPHSSLRRARRATLCLLNAERRRHGLKSLRSNSRLRRAAVRHSKDMVRKRYFSHNSRSGRSFGKRIRVAGYRGSLIGENIAWGEGHLSTPRSTVRAWMRSPGHRANILRGGFREIGIGISGRTPRGGYGGTYTTDFGRR